MANGLTTRFIEMPLTLEQLAFGLRKLSKSEKETLNILLNNKNIINLKKSLKQSSEGQLEPLETILED